MQRVGLARDQNTFDDVGLTLYRCPGVYYIAILIFHNKFGSADLLISGNICLADMHLRGVILHDYGLHGSVFLHLEDDIACDHIAVR